MKEQLLPGDISGKESPAKSKDQIESSIKLLLNLPPVNFTLEAALKLHVAPQKHLGKLRSQK